MNRLMVVGCAVMFLARISNQHVHAEQSEASQNILYGRANVEHIVSLPGNHKAEFKIGKRIEQLRDGGVLVFNGKIFPESRARRVDKKVILGELPNAILIFISKNMKVVSVWRVVRPTNSGYSGWQLNRCSWKQVDDKLLEVSPVRSKNETILIAGGDPAIDLFFDKCFRRGVASDQPLKK